MTAKEDEEKIATATSRIGMWWERARVSVLGVSILMTVITTAYLAGQSLTEVSTKIDHTSRLVVEIRDTVKGHDVSIADVSERLAKLEVSRDQQNENIRMFWARDWSDLKTRVERIEAFILGKPSITERAQR